MTDAEAATRRRASRQCQLPAADAAKSRNWFGPLAACGHAGSPRLSVNKAVLMIRSSPGKSPGVFTQGPCQVWLRTRGRRTPTDDVHVGDRTPFRRVSRVGRLQLFFCSSRGAGGGQAQRRRTIELTNDGTRIGICGVPPDGEFFQTAAALFPAAGNTDNRNSAFWHTWLPFGPAHDGTRPFRLRQRS